MGQSLQGKLRERSSVIMYFTNRRGVLSELFDATFEWLEHKDLRTPSREFRMMLQSYRALNAGMSIGKLAPKKVD
jgi:hypothetical protein